MCRVFGGGFCIGVCFKHTPSVVSVLYYSSALGFHVERNRKVTVSFCFPDPLSQTMKDFSIQFGGLEGHPCHRAKTGSLCLISHFLYSSGEFWHWRMFPPHSGPLWKWLHNTLTRKLKKKKKGKNKLWIRIVYYHLLNRELCPYCVVLFQAVSVGSKKRKSDFLICWNIIYVQFEKVVMAWVWVPGGAWGGGGSVFCYKKETCPFWFSKSCFHVFSWKKENIEETWEGEPIH